MPDLRCHNVQTRIQLKVVVPDEKLHAKVLGRSNLWHGPQKVGLRQ